MATKAEARPELTDKQREVLNFIKKFQRKNGMPPTMQEMADDLGYANASGVFGHLNALERKGYIDRGQNKARQIKVID